MRPQKEHQHEHQKRHQQGPLAFDLAEQLKELLVHNLENQIHLLYEYRMGMRTATLGDPVSMTPLLCTWMQVHRNHHLLRKQLIHLLYETSHSLFQSGGAQKAPGRPR